MVSKGWQKKVFPSPYSIQFAVVSGNIAIEPPASND